MKDLQTAIGHEADEITQLADIIEERGRTEPTPPTFAMARALIDLAAVRNQLRNIADILDHPA